MTTDFNYNNKTIDSSGPIKPSGTDQPGDPRTRVDFYSDIESIPNPYIGMIVTVKMDETNQNKMTDYKVLSLKANALGIANSVIDRVQKYSEYLGVNIGESIDLSGYATKDELNSKANTSDIPTNTSELNNDSGFLTSIPSEYVTETEMNEAIANISSGGSVSQEDISTAVNNYLTEHPVTGGATTEQANQIEANKTEIVDARGGEVSLNKRLVAIESGENINEVSFEKIKKARPQGEIYTIDNFNTWSKWSGVSGDVNKVTSLSNGGIEIAISNALTSNLVLFKNDVNLQGKKLTLRFDITVKSIISDDVDRFTLSLNDSITLKNVYLNKFKIGKTTTVSIDFNDAKLVTGKLALVLNKPCNCTLENLKLEECMTVEGYQTLEEVITDVEELKLKSQCIKELVLPSVIPVVKELETNIFWDNILLNTNINSVERIDVGNSIGGRNNVMKDRWRIYLSSSQTDITQTFNVYFNDTANVSNTINTNIKVLDKNIGSGQTRKIIFIGDSLTENNKYEPELLKLFENDVMNINLLGSRGSGANLHEGRSGWTSKHYCTTSNFNSRDNAFWNPSTSKFDFSYYMTSQGYSKVDYVFIHLGTNCLANPNTETLSYFKEMVDSIKAFNSNIVVFIGLCPPLSSRSDNFGLKNKRIKLVKLLLNEFDNREGERILISPLVLNFDAYNGFPAQEISGNRHSNENLKVVTDNTHPMESEYFKMSDTIYCAIKYAVSLGY